jgi:hypothetical protein
MFKVFIFNGYGFIAETRVLADYAGVRAFFGRVPTFGVPVAVNDGTAVVGGRCSS